MQSRSPKMREAAGLPSKSQDTEKTLRAAPVPTWTQGAARTWARGLQEGSSGGQGGLASVSCSHPCSCLCPIPAPVQFLSPFCPRPRPAHDPVPALVPSVSLPLSYLCPGPSLPLSLPLPLSLFLSRPSPSPCPAPVTAQVLAPCIPSPRRPRPGPSRYRFCSRRSRSCGRGSAASSCSAMARPGNGCTGGSGGRKGQDGSRSFRRPLIGFVCFSACWRPRVSLVPTHFAEWRFLPTQAGEMHRARCCVSPHHGSTPQRQQCKAPGAPLLPSAGRALAALTPR